MPIFPYDALKRQAKHLHAARVFVAIGLNTGQVGVIKVALWLQRPDARIPHIKRIWLRLGEQVATEVYHRIGVALNAPEFCCD